MCKGHSPSGLKIGDPAFVIGELFALIGHSGFHDLHVALEFGHISLDRLKLAVKHVVHVLLHDGKLVFNLLDEDLGNLFGAIAATTHSAT